MLNRTTLAALLTATLVAALSLSGGGATVAQAKQKPAGHGHGGYEILFVRHAHTNYPLPEMELSATGIEQAAVLAEGLHDARIKSIDTSMMLRAFQTGDDVAADHDLPIRADEAISEVGFDLSDVPPSQQTQKIHDVMETWLKGRQRSNGFLGESYNEVVARWSPWWKDYVREHRSDRGTGVVVSHGALLALMLQRTCSNRVTPTFVLDNLLDNTGVIEARLSPSGQLTCSEWNGVAVPRSS